MKKDWVEIKRGVRHGCLLSLGLFFLYSQVVMYELMGLDSISVGGRNVNNIQFSGDTVMIAD